MQEFGADGMIQLATRIPKRLHRAARLQAIEEGRSMMELVGEALAEHLVRCQEDATGPREKAPRRRHRAMLRTAAEPG